MAPRHLFSAFALMLCAATALPAHAQSYQCRAPAKITVPKPSKSGPVRRLPITGYTLAASWSPEFCKNREGQSRHAAQCSGKNGRFGFILHGLWPESRSSWPQFCPTSRRLSAQEARRNLCMMPSPSLMVHQWTKHGSCMSPRPEAYFKASRILWGSLKWPAMDSLSREKALSAGQFRKAFLARNPGWRRQDAIGLKLNRRGWLQEVRLCYGKDFMPARCDRKRFGPADGARLKIWRGG